MKASEIDGLEILHAKDGLKAKFPFAVKFQGKIVPAILHRNGRAVVYVPHSPVDSIRELVEMANEQNISLRHADLIGADLRGADLEGANLSYADLRWADLRDCKLTGANLSNARLEGSRIKGAELNGVVCIGDQHEPPALRLVKK